MILFVIFVKERENEKSFDFFLESYFNSKSNSKLCSFPSNSSILAELMLPDGAHNREQDWTVFFLNQNMPEVTSNLPFSSLLLFAHQIILLVYLDCCLQGTEKRLEVIIGERTWREHLDIWQGTWNSPAADRPRISLFFDLDPMWRSWRLIFISSLSKIRVSGGSQQQGFVGPK